MTWAHRGDVLRNEVPAEAKKLLLDFPGLGAVVLEMIFGAREKKKRSKLDEMNKEQAIKKRRVAAAGQE